MKKEVLGFGTKKEAIKRMFEIKNRVAIGMNLKPRYKKMTAKKAALRYGK